MSGITITTERLTPHDSRFAVTHRQELITGFDQAKLSNATCVLIGAGGIGGEMAEGLCRKGIGRLRIFDHDVVDHTNLNRQHFFKDDVGESKARCLARNLAPHCHAGTVLQGYELSFEDGLAAGVDLAGDFVVCGVDNGAARVAVSKHYRRLGIPTVYINVDLLAECGHVFVQESTAGTPCFGCAFPRTLHGGKAPCFVPASKDVLKVVAGLALYAADSLLMERRRAWNFRRVHLAGFAPDETAILKLNSECALCSIFEQQQVSPAVGTPSRRVSTGSDSPFPSL